MISSVERTADTSASVGASIEQLQRIGLKLFAADGVAVRPHELVPVFHRWIQSRAIDAHLLVDVADYEHVPDGPGVVLIAHEGTFSLDCAAGRMGLAYTRKTAVPGRLADRLRAVARCALLACRLVEGEAGVKGRIRFRGDELQLFANDRLHAPNTPETFAAFRPSLMGFLHTLYGTDALTITPESDPRERLGVHVQASAPIGIGELLQRLG